MISLVLRLALASTLPLLLFLFVDAKPGAGLIWDFANACGLMAAMTTLLLFAYSGRPMPKPCYDGKFFMNLHRNLGYAVVVLLGIHITLLLVTEPLVVEYLKPSASWPMLSGTVATIALILLVPLSLPPLRQKLWRTHRRFKHWHLALSSAALVLTTVHVTGSSFYTDEAWKTALWCVAVGAALIMPLRREAESERNKAPRKRNMSAYASGLISGLVLWILMLAAGFSMIANIGLPL